MGRIWLRQEVCSWELVGPWSRTSRVQQGRSTGGGEIVVSVFKELAERLGNLSDIIGVGTALFALYAALKARSIRKDQEEDARKRAEPIQLILVRQSDQQEHVLGYRPRRDQATRNEIMGILGMYSGETRFDSSTLVPILENGEFDNMIAGNVNGVHVTVSDEDYGRLAMRDRNLGDRAAAERHVTVTRSFTGCSHAAPGGALRRWRSKLRRPAKA